MPIRLARYSDLDAVSKILAAAFYDEELNDCIFPYRKQFPDDYVFVWKQKVVKNWWDYNKIWLVSYEKDPSQKSGEIITGAAEWGREGKGSDRLWGLVRWWDPRRLISPFIGLFYSFYRLLIPNRSIAVPSLSDPNPLNKWNFAYRIGPFSEHFFNNPPWRANHWELSTLGVHPSYQGRGIGQKMVAWGLERAKKDGLPAVVIGAQGTEPFYQRCGFRHLVGNVSTVEIEDDDEGKKVVRIDKTNPLKLRGIKGGSVMWTHSGDEIESQ
ncbi:uncharacterized protein Z520_00690 [Fonsecaea multimorphosa CBS 102226]|uniref:N-acetyltransferase domain-containing protein n=1 Tax=Fonsecaea multimorphosa CBS 102226 TaxID=1442371 RepID=A0A0D2KCZ5_9EURO|nr:uncharacterized protein Z520_00690 [Fonsecaea multimorphosa CBS 102226]KIY03998.1 hypothetical protein Z520_00690 [Fonsecaea multimorphosa CBS 102226]OAL31836.1 hypothetical protein AYO22_00706 [Fonsecaea multimorphosa]